MTATFQNTLYLLTPPQTPILKSRKYLLEYIGVARY